MRLALDAMGGDHGPPVIVGGALKARRELPDFPEIVFYGDETAIRAALAERGESEGSFEIVHTTETTSDNNPRRPAVRT